MKARLPQGMGGGPQNLQGMLKQAQKMQENMAKVQAELEEKVYTATVGGGAVKAEMTGKKVLQSLVIAPDAVDPEDVEMLQDLVISAVNEVIRAVESDSEEQMAKVTGGMNLPFGM